MTRTIEYEVRLRDGSAVRLFGTSFRKSGYGDVKVYYGRRLIAYFCGVDYIKEYM